MRSVPLMLSCSAAQAPIHLAVASHQFSGGCVMATLSNFWRFLFAGHWYASFKARDKNG